MYSYTHEYYGDIRGQVVANLLLTLWGYKGPGGGQVVMGK